MARIIIGAVGCSFFIVPVFGGVFNIGTLTGLVFFGLIFLSGVFRKKLDVCLRRLFESKRGRSIGYVFLSVVLFAVITVSAETACIVGAVLDKPKNSDVTLIVLGCKVNGTSPSLMLRERIDAAHEFLEANPEAKCVLSGGKGEDEDISEAQCMKDELVAAGIDPSRLYIEDKSTSTKENIEMSRDIIEKCGLGKNVAVVTNEFHEYRAGLVAREAGLNCSSVAAKTAVWLLPTYLVREWYAIVFEVFFR